MTSPHDDHDHDHDNDHLHDTTTRVGALVAHHPGWVITPVGPGKDTHGTLGPSRRKAVGGPTPTPQKAKSRCNDALPRQNNTHVFRQNKKRFQYCTYPSGQEINSERFLRVHLSHRMCNQFTLHHEFRIDTRRTKFEQQTNGILHVCGSNEPGTQRSGCNWPGCTASCLVQAESVEETSKHRIGVDIKLAQKKGFKFYQTRSNAIILYDTLPAYCIPKAIMIGTGEIICEKVYASPRPPPKISFEDNWMKELGFRSCWRW